MILISEANFIMTLGVIAFFGACAGAAIMYFTEHYLNNKEIDAREKKYGKRSGKTRKTV
jgi:hypothetical protein